MVSLFNAKEISPKLLGFLLCKKSGINICDKIYPYI